MIALTLGIVWFSVDRLLWSRMEGPEDLYTRQLMVALLLGSWVLLSAYVGIWRRDRNSLKLAIAGAIGFGIGFPLSVGAGCGGGPFPICATPRSVPSPVIRRTATAIAINPLVTPNWSRKVTFLSG